MSTARERLEEILKDQKLSIQELVNKLNVNRNIISSLKNGQTTNFTIYLSDRIVDTFPEYSQLWVLTGKEPKYAVHITGDTNIDIDQSENKRENSGSGNYYENSDAATIQLQIEIERLKVENENLKSNLEKSETERQKLLDILINK